jgi:hypothetical protein
MSFNISDSSKGRDDISHRQAPCKDPLSTLVCTVCCDRSVLLVLSADTAESRQTASMIVCYTHRGIFFALSYHKDFHISCSHPHFIFLIVPSTASKRNSLVQFETPFPTFLKLSPVLYQVIEAIRIIVKYAFQNPTRREPLVSLHLSPEIRS